jgi:hypothetical protein
MTDRRCDRAPPPLFDRRLRLESWRRTQDHGHGIVAGKAMCGDATPYDDIPGTGSTSTGDLQVARLVSDPAATVVRANAPSHAFIAANNPRQPGTDQVEPTGGSRGAGRFRGAVARSLGLKKTANARNTGKDARGASVTPPPFKE